MAEPEVEVEEKKALRPYRRFVGLLFALTILLLSVLILRGIIRSLDRLPTAGTLARPAVVDTRALRACAEDLEKLEARTRLVGGQALAHREPTNPDWAAQEQGLEVERLTIVARCHLDQPSGDPVVQDLSGAANAVERLIRTYGLLHARLVAEGHPLSKEVAEALGRANAALKAR